MDKSASESAKIDFSEINLSSLAKYFSDEGEAYRLLESIRWPKGPICPHCGCINHAYHLKNQRTKSGKISDRSMWKCAECRKVFTVTVGTVFEDSHIPLSKWMQGSLLMAASKNGIAALELARTLDLSYKAAWFMAHRLRHAMVDMSEDLFRGIVEADETWIGGRVKGQDWKENKTPVVSLVQRGGRVRSRAVTNVNGRNLRKALEDEVDPEAILMTDSNPAYRKAGKSYRGHYTVNHEIDEYVRGQGPTAAHVNSAENFFSQLKRSIDGTHHRVSKRHLHRYLAEFDLRYNLRETKDGERMAQMIRQAAGRRLTYREPTGRPKAV